MNINDLTLFVRTADVGSITAAAEQLDLSTAAASAALKRLEKQLEIQLFIRSTRQLRITAEGERFLLYCRNALVELDIGKAAIHALAGKVAGELRISAPSDLGRNLLQGWIDEIMDEHPDLSVNLMHRGCVGRLLFESSGFGYSLWCATGFVDGGVPLGLTGSSHLRLTELSCQPRYAATPCGFAES